MRKCHSCGETKGLKAITMEYCDEPGHHHEQYGYSSSICKTCYFDTCACEQDFHEVSECLEDKDCPNHKDSVDRLENWDKLDYNYKPKHDN